MRNALHFLLKMIFNIKNRIINEECEQSISFSLLSILPQSGMKLFFGTIAVVSQTLQEFRLLKTNLGTSLVVQWLRIRLPVQGTRVRALVREDPTCHEATKPVRHDY